MRKPQNSALAAFLAAALAFSGAHTANAATKTWSGNSSVDFNTAGNWSALPVSGADILSFGANSTSGFALNNNFASGFVVNGFTFSAGSGAYNITGNDIVLGGNIAMSTTSGATVIGLNMSMTADRTIQSRGGGLTLTGNLSGAGGLIKSATGIGTLVLSGNNTYTGSTTINAGAISVGTVATNLGGTGAINLGSTTNQGTLITTGSGSETISRDINLSGGDGGSGGLTNNNASAGALTFSGSIGSNTSGNKTLFLAGSSTGANKITGNISDSSVSGTTALVISDGAWTLSGSNTFSGGVTLNSGGTLRTGSATSLGTGIFTLNGGSWNGNVNVTIANNINIATNSNGNALHTVTEFSGQISGTGNWGVNGFSDGVVKFSGDNSGWTGNWSFNGENVLQLNNAKAIGSGTTITFNTPNADNKLRGTLESLVDLTGANSVTQAVNLGSTSGFVNNVATIKTTANMTMTGVVSGSSDSALVKSGNATLTFSNNNTYTGTTTVSAGTLLVNGDSSAATGATTVSSGAKLGGSGTVGGAVTINSGGRLAPGNSPGNLTVNGSVTIASGGVLTMEINGATVGTEYDRVTMTGGGSVFSLTGTNNLELSLGYVPAANALFFLVDNQGGSAISGIFEELNGVTTDLSQGALFTVGGQQFQISYTADLAGGTFLGGDDIALQAVPEPATWALLAAGLTVTVVLRRRRSNV